MSEEKTSNKPLRPLTETLDAKIMVYDGDRYLFTIGITSEFEKDEQLYNRSTMHDALMEYLLEKSQDWKERLKKAPVGKEHAEFAPIYYKDKLYARMLRPHQQL